MWNGPDDVLALDPHRSRLATVAAEPGMLVEVTGDGFVGAVVRVDDQRVSLRDRRGRERSFELHPGAFIVDDRPVTLVPPSRPAPAAPAEPRRTASGSYALPGAPPRVARPDRIFVEGRHDAELVERVWGDDLRIEGVAVEYLDGIDDLESIVAAFGPRRGKRLGILVDHLVPGSKEQRIAANISHPHVRITGHPFVDVWAAVRPAAVGIDTWPDVPRGQDWKRGVCDALGVGEPGEFWRRILGSVRSYTDLDRSLVGAVESLIDFVTAEPAP